MESDPLLPVHTAGKITFNLLRGFNSREIDQTNEEHISLPLADARRINKTGCKSPLEETGLRLGKMCGTRRPVSRRTKERQLRGRGELGASVLLL